jgi:hypothetical protein
MTTPPKVLGRYKTPRFRLGDVVRCARRGDVRIVGLSDAPIPWPTGQLPRGGRRPALTCPGRSVRASASSCSDQLSAWRKMQRFDFVVRKRVLTPGEARDLRERLSGESPYRAAAALALRQLKAREP